MLLSSISRLCKGATIMRMLLLFSLTPGIAALPTFEELRPAIEAAAKQASVDCLKSQMETMAKKALCDMVFSIISGGTAVSPATVMRELGFGYAGCIKDAIIKTLPSAGDLLKRWMTEKFGSEDPAKLLLSLGMAIPGAGFIAQIPIIGDIFKQVTGIGGDSPLKLLIGKIPGLNKIPGMDKLLSGQLGKFFEDLKKKACDEAWDRMKDWAKKLWDRYRPEDDPDPPAPPPPPPPPDAPVAAPPPAARTPRPLRPQRPVVATNLFNCIPVPSGSPCIDQEPWICSIYSRNNDCARFPFIAFTLCQKTCKNCQCNFCMDTIVPQQKCHKELCDLWEVQKSCPRTCGKCVSHNYPANPRARGRTVNRMEDRFARQPWEKSLVQFSQHPAFDRRNRRFR